MTTRLGVDKDKVFPGDLCFVLPASCTKFVFPGCLHFDNGATCKINDVLTEHGGR